MKIWDNTGMCIFVVQDETSPAYLSCVGIPNIDYYDVTEDSVCQLGCHKLGRAIVTLEGVLPQAVHMFHLAEGADLLLCHKCRGDRKVYDEREVIMRFLHCHQVAKYMPDVAVLHADQDRLRLFVSVECEVEMYPDGMKRE